MLLAIGTDIPHPEETSMADRPDLLPPESPVEKNRNTRQVSYLLWGLARHTRLNSGRLCLQAQQLLMDSQDLGEQQRPLRSRPAQARAPRASRASQGAVLAGGCLCAPCRSPEARAEGDQGAGEGDEGEGDVSKYQAGSFL
jgi:hypothetical protein